MLKFTTTFDEAGTANCKTCKLEITKDQVEAGGYYNCSIDQSNYHIECASNDKYRCDRDHEMKLITTSK